MPGTEYPISLVIKAVDKATEPLRAINAKIAGLSAPFGKLSHAFKEFGEASGLTKLGEHTKELGKSLKEAGHAAFEVGERFLEMEAVGVFALYEIFHGAIEAGDKLKEMSQRTGLSVDAYAQLQFAAGQAHVNQEQFNDAMDKFNKSLGEAKAGGGPLLTFLNKVSPALANQMKNAHGVTEAFDLMIKTFQIEANDPEKIAALTGAAFGKGVKNMGVFMSQGSAAIEEQRKKFKELVGSQEEFAEGAEEADKATKQVAAAFGGLRNAAASELFPVFTELAKTLASFISSKRTSIAAWAKDAAASIKTWVDEGGVRRLIDGFSEFAKSIGKVIDFLGGFRNTAILAAAIMAGPLISALVGVGQAIYGVGSAALPVLIRALTVAIPLLADLALPLVTFLVAAAPFLVAALAIGAAGQAIYDNWVPIKELFADIWYNMKQIAAFQFGGSKGMNLRSLTGEYNAAPAFKGLPPESRRGYIAPAPAPGSGNSSSASGAATVTVDFQNIPKGVRVNQESKGTPIELNLGYTMLEI